MAKIVIFSDINPLITGFISFFNKKRFPGLNIESYIYINFTTENYNNLIEGEDLIYLVFDFYQETDIKEEKNSFTIDSLKKAEFENIITKILTIEQIKRKIAGVIVFAYNNWDTTELYAEFEKMNTLFKENKLENAHTIETSHIFSRIPSKQIYKDKGKLLGARNDLEDYGKLIGSIAASSIKQTAMQLSTSTELQYLHKNSFIFNEYISNINLNFFKEDFPLSTFSFIVKEINEYLIDWPFKDYYELQNVYIKDNIDKIFKKDINANNDYLEGCNFYYFKYCINDSFLPIELQRIDAYFDNKHSRSDTIINVFNEGIWYNNFDEKLFKDWLNILVTSIFFHADSLDWKVWKNLPPQDCKKECFKDCKVCENSKIGIFWFMHKTQSIEDNNLHGLFTYTFYDTNKELGDDDIIKKGKSLYNIRRPIIETKAKETLFPFLFSTLNKHATRAAISQVMARNMSHNIGSHVLSNMVTEDSVKENFTRTTEPYISLFNSLYGDINGQNKTINNPLFRISNFNSYLRTRMDFLADIATGEPAMEVTRLLVRDVIGELDKNRILLNHISGVDNFEYSIAVKDCRKCKLPNCTNLDCKSNGTDKDIPVSLPNGIMGYHALFILIENVIRNTAKHQSGKSNTKPDDNMEKVFTLEIRDSGYDNTFYEVQIYDNIEVDGVLNVDEQLYKEHIGTDYSSAEVKFNTYLDWLVFQQNCRINDPIINPSTNRLREGAWGLIEMDASAAYLRKLAPESIDDDIYNLQLLDEEKRLDATNKHLNIIKAVKKGNHLAYRFHLMKPKELLVIDEIGDTYKKLKNEITSNNKSKHNELLENGIWVMQRSKPTDADYFDINSVYAYPFMLVITANKFDLENYLYTNFNTRKDDQEIARKVLRGNLPSRIIVCKSENSAEETFSHLVTYINSEHILMQTLVKAENIVRQIPISEEDLKNQTLLDMVWQVWIKHKVNYNKIRINDTEIIEKIINTYILSQSNLGKNIDEKFSIYLDWHADMNINRRTEFEHYLAYPSAVKLFIENATQDLLADNSNDFKPNILFDKIGLSILTDSFLTKIFVIDERIQMAWNKVYKKEGPTKQQLYECGGLFSPLKEELDLSEQTYTEEYKKILINLIADIEKRGNLKGLDYIVIHLGIIEKMLICEGKPKKKENVMDFIIELQDKLDSKTKVVITSGRGKPDNLPEQVPFVSFSTLSQYSIETPFKPFLNQILQNARTFKN